MSGTAATEGGSCLPAALSPGPKDGHLQHQLRRIEQQLKTRNDLLRQQLALGNHWGIIDELSVLDDDSIPMYSRLNLGSVVSESTSSGQTMSSDQRRDADLANYATEPTQPMPEGSIDAKFEAAGLSAHPPNGSLVDDVSRYASQLSSSSKSAAVANAQQQYHHSNGNSPSNTSNRPRIDDDIEAGCISLPGLSINGKGQNTYRLTAMRNDWELLSKAEQIAFLVSQFILVSSIITMLALFQTMSKGDENEGKKILLICLFTDLIAAILGTIAVRRNFAEVVLVITTVLVIGILLNAFIDILVSSSTTTSAQTIATVAVAAVNAVATSAA
jgi:hypothetical protein